MEFVLFFSYKLYSIKKYPLKKSRALFKWKIMYLLYVCLVGDEGQKARKSKQEAFPTLETVFTKLQLLSYFDQHQVTSQVAILKAAFFMHVGYSYFLKNLLFNI